MTSTPTFLGSGDPARRQPNPWWLDKLADDVTGEGAFIEGAAQGAEAVRSIVTYARTVYEYQEFNFTSDYGDTAADTVFLDGAVNGLGHHFGGWGV